MILALIVARVVALAVDAGVFALGYWIALDSWHASPVFAAGFGIVAALSAPVKAPA